MGVLWLPMVEESVLLLQHTSTSTTPAVASHAISGEWMQKVLEQFPHRNLEATMSSAGRVAESI
jgi:hypothetical protein